MNKNKFIAGLLISCFVQVCAIAAEPTNIPRMRLTPIQVNTTQQNTTIKNVDTTQMSPAAQEMKKTVVIRPTQKPTQKIDKDVLKDENGRSITKEQQEELKALKKTYKGVTKDENVMRALELLKGGLGDFSRRAILGNNLTGEPMTIEFSNLAQFGQMYSNFDALGWKKKDRLYIYLNQKHEDAPKEALAAVLAHEALHQDEFNSLNEETYAWTLEAAVWTKLTEKNPKLADNYHPLVVRENTLKKLFVKGNYTSKFIRKTVFSNPGYANLPSRSPGFEDDDL